MGRRLHQRLGAAPKSPPIFSPFLLFLPKPQHPTPQSPTSSTPTPMPCSVWWLCPTVTAGSAASSPM